MSTPIYCILSGGDVHCIPVTVFSTSNQDTIEKLTKTPVPNSHKEAEPVPPATPAILAIKNRNLLYTLNNPSLSDLESDVSRRLSTTSSTHEEDTSFSECPPVPQSTKLRLSGPILGSDSDSEPEITSVKTPVIGVTAPLPHSPNDSHFSEFSIASKSLPIVASATDDFEPQHISSILDSYATHAVYLPQYSVDLQENLDSDYQQIRVLLTKIFPSWSSEITIKQLTGGITNMLLACTHAATSEKLLMRVYGKGTNLIIDRNREFVSHLVLNSLKLAPSIHARFANGLIYGFLPGRSLDPAELSNSYTSSLIAQQLGNWHSSIDCESIDIGVNKLRKYTAAVKKQSENGSSSELKTEKHFPKKKSTINNLWDLIEDWISIVPANEALVKIFQDQDSSKTITTDNIREVVQSEFNWLKQTLRKATKSPVVVSHCDLLSGNIIVPETSEYEEKTKSPCEELPPIEKNPIQFIDYEYMLPAPRAFDIANHFAEWQGFDCNRAAIPEPSSSNPVMVTWCKAYLGDMDAPKEQVDYLINEIACFYGMPGFYWGIWAMIQSELSTIDFNYAEYSGLRLEEYWIWKKSFVENLSTK